MEKIKESETFLSGPNPELNPQESLLLRNLNIQRATSGADESSVKDTSLSFQNRPASLSVSVNRTALQLFFLFVT